MGQTVESCLFEFGPMLVAACGLSAGGPVADSLFVIAELVQDCCMFDEHHLEGWCMARDLIRQDLEVPVSQELFQTSLKIWTEGPGGPQGGGSWCWFPLPPFYGCIDGL